MNKRKQVSHSIIPVDQITNSIYILRGHRVMLSPDLADLYNVETRSLIQAVKRNIERFPDDFMFQLKSDEYEFLKSQNVISKTTGRGGPHRALPYAFTEQGVAMLSSVLRSDRAVQVNIEIMRAFVRLRRMLESHKELSKQLENLEKKYDAQFKVVFDAIRKLMEPPANKKKRSIGFAPWKED